MEQMGTNALRQLYFHATTQPYVYLSKKIKKYTNKKLSIPVVRKDGNNMKCKAYELRTKKLSDLLKDGKGTSDFISASHPRTPPGSLPIFFF